MDSAAALKLVKDVDEIYAAKGKNVVHLDLKKDKPSEEVLRSVLIGPTGILRAPTLRVGRTLIVGFSQSMYEQLLSK